MTISFFLFFRSG